ncbi:MAG: VWA domain-containing protein, partial [Clostridia bacterium]|nr:VWA domain-containing protein [Clostridia bacterium]
MGITNSNKTVDRQVIGCSDSAIVTLALSAAPDIVSAPVDLVLALDNSASMTGEAFTILQASANQIIDIIDSATGDMDGVIENSRVGIVSFDSTATIESPLETNAILLKQIVNNLTTEAAGTTNHYDAFSKAISMFSTTSENEQIIIMITDGVDSEGTSADNIARYARETLGITIYMIGIEGTEGIDVANLNEWATDPDTSHVIVAPTEASIEAMLGALGENITKAGATDIQILDTVNDDFEITEVIPPMVGTATLVSPQSVAWAIDSLGTETDEGATL